MAKFNRRPFASFRTIQRTYIPNAFLSLVHPIRDDIDSGTRVALHPTDGSYCHDKGTMLLEFTRNVEKRRRKSRSTIEEEYIEKKQKMHESVRTFVRAQRNAPVKKNVIRSSRK